MKNTPGRKLIMDLLAKSVAKINADCSESPLEKETKSLKPNTQNKRKICDNQIENKTKKIKEEIKEEYIEDDKDITKNPVKDVKTFAEDITRKKIKEEKQDHQREVTVRKNASIMDTAGRRLILELLAKSVEKINIAEAETACLLERNNESKRTNFPADLIMKMEKNINRKENPTLLIKKDIKEEKIELKREYLELDMDTYIIKGKHQRHCDKANTKSLGIKTENQKREEESKGKGNERSDSSLTATSGKRLIIDLFDKSVDKHQGDQKGLKNNSIVHSESKANHAKSKNKTTIQLSSDNNSVGNLQTPRKSCHKLFKYSPDEDKILLHAVELFGEQISISELSRKLNRSHRSVKARIENLKVGKKDARRYTLVEDLVIMDAVMKQLPEQSLTELDLPSFGVWKIIGDQLDRRQTHVRNRWEYYLKPWLLQYFAGTLNLDIRRTLANYLADNFEDVNCIDWPTVASRPEFCGHTEVSLHYYFGAYLFQISKVKMSGGALEEVTLKHIADNENQQFKNNKLRKVTEKVLKKQQDVISYFEIYTKLKGIDVVKLLPK